MKKFRRLLIQILLGILLCVVLLELAYRYQWGDFYAVEWSHFNDGILREGAEREVLVMGDSFSTSDSGYVEQLRKEFPDWNISNSAVPGTGVVEASYMASRRFSDRKPDTFIYQIYLGNDLFDIEKPVNWGELGFMRNLYWWGANRMRSLAWVNYKSGQFQAAPESDAKESELGFRPEWYNKREVRYFEAEPDWIRAQADPQNEHWSDQRERYFDYLDDLMEYPEEYGSRVLLLIVPHCSHLGVKYQRRMEAIGMLQGEEIAGQPAGNIWVKELFEYASSHEGIDVLYPLEFLRKYDEEIAPVYYQNDPHLNRAGQEALAIKVKEWLDEE